ncbi:MAG: glycosyltransferase family 4 protein, partial [Ktedonobacteraceae bacterium]|nr:glycosyltransferase family 4 protein [Ktedonobacteraceae bacterium]
MPGKADLRVLMVATRSFPYTGGVETHIREVGRRLVNSGVKVTVLSTDVSRQLPPVEEVDGMLTYRVPAWPADKDYYFAPAIYRFITRGRWDVVHCQGYHNLVAPMTMLAARQAKMPYVLTFHSGGESFRIRKLFRGMQRRALRPLLARAEQLIGPSTWEVEFFRQKLRLPAGQFMVIPNGAYHLPEVQESNHRTTDGKLIVSIGRLERYKGHQRVIAALPMVQEQVPDVRLRIVGVGPYESTLQKMASELGVAGRVEIRPVPPGDDGAMAALIRQANLVT